MWVGGWGRAKPKGKKRKNQYKITYITSNFIIISLQITSHKTGEKNKQQI